MRDTSSDEENRAVDDKIAKDLLGDAFRMQLMSAYYYNY